MNSDEERINWEIDTVRRAISIDWKHLATKNLTADQRKAIREHLNICNSTLKDLVERNRAASRKAKLDR
jgi:hypothetical protein